MIGDKAPAARKIESKSEQGCRCNEPPWGHKAAGSLVRKSLSRSVGMDSIHGGTMVRKSDAF
jgi:hypothetical protein